MPEPACCAEVRKRLARHGLPGDRIDRVTRELAEHWDDLCAAAIDKGLTPSQAAADADTRIGDAQQLANEVISGLRRSSWLGRHPVAAVCVVPLLLAPLLMAVIVFPLFWLDTLFHLTDWSVDNRPNAQLITAGMWVVYYVATMIAPAWLSWAVWRAGLGTRWIQAVCAWCVLTALLRAFDADALQRTVSMGVRFPWRFNVHTTAILLFHCLFAAGFLLAVREATKKKTHAIETKPVL